AAGILFTADPINGRRDEIVINAAWGLGEAIVGGLVSPDTIIADKTTGKIKSMEVTEKTVITVMTETGTEEKPLEDTRRKSRVLKKAQVLELVSIARKIEDFYGAPQDIEWCRANGNFYIVQSRPITALPPEWKQPKPKVMYARGSFAEFVPDAVSPLFATLAIPIAKELTLKMMNDLLEKDIPDTYQFDVINGYVYVGIPMRWEVLGPFIGATIKMSKTYLKTASERWSAASDKLRATAAQWYKTDLSTLTAMQLIDGVREIFRVTAEAYNVAQSGTIPNATSSEISFCKFYDLLVKRKSDPAGATLLFGLDNQPLRAEKALFDMAIWLSGQPDLVAAVKQTSTDEIVKKLTSPQDDPAWNEFRSRFTAYLEEFGHAIYDLDFARPLPLDDPAPLVEAVKAYLAGTGGNPYQRQQEADARRERTIAEMTRRLDPLRRKWFLKLLKWATDTAPQREDSIAGIGLGHPQIRRLLGELGRRLAEAGGIKSAQDVYWLQANELESLAARLDKDEMIEDYSAKVVERKTEHQGFRRLSPPPVLPQNSWMSIFFPHNDQSSDTIKGFAASAGKVTARACIMFGPEDFNKMKPGDVLVAVTTTPAWTPLFTMASAVVTDIGGPLSHSSIVAREYGIPAVLATGVATRRIHDGQTVTVDGNAGTVTLDSV
ncbi:MAG TPA: PEP/pyruvate-binding domain-containing protein, partial [Anaerolineales bacterium]|nr:PEP/pyruvate-binding domain-containing protein [Anaerolineales bacterium]